MAESTKTEFKDTLNLPQTTLPMRANATVRELEIQKFWVENNIYEKMIGERDKTNSFVLHDGPPYLSSEKIHVGTALNKILKDILIKYKSQRGFYAPYVPGYDGHGLPIENAVVKTLKGGRHSISEAELRAKCREFAHKNLKGQESEFKRLGVLGNWEHPYLTINPEYEAEQVRVFGEMYKKGYIEKGLKPVYWCAACETALAEAEVEYADHTSTSIYVRFKFEDDAVQKIENILGSKTDKDIYAIIWTTTPWTIPSNMAISMHPRFVYTFFEYKNDIYVVAEELLNSFLNDVEWDEADIKVLGSCSGQDLELLNTKHPLLNRKSPIILGEHVTLDAGTGSVHTAPGHGLEDYEVGCKYGIEVFSPLDGRGVWTDTVGIDELVDVPYYKGNSMVIEMLQNCGALLKQQDIQHSYPHCWRCKKPVIYRATPQWFVKVDKFRDKALEAVHGVKWIPASGENRIGNMVESRTDWCISRQRAWGVPIPIFYCEDCGEVICNDSTIENVAKMFEKESSDAWVKYSAEELLPEGFVCPKCGKKHFRKEKDIMDVWFDSGVSWRAVVEKRSEELGHTPVDMYLEGSDQHRGWFQSSLLTSVATQGKAPYKQVLTHGFVFGEDGRKMSKSLGNFIRPDDIIKKYGADILRLWAASVDYRNDIKIGNNIVGQLVEIFKKTRNTARFLIGNLFDFNPETDYVEYDELKNIDKFALHKLNKLIEEVTVSFENYEFYKYFQSLQNFAAVDLSSFYLDIVKDRLYTAGKKSLSRRACQTVLFENLMALVKILAPVMPHQAEDIWQNVPEVQRGGLISILLSDWPVVNEKWNNPQLEEDFTKILKSREVVSRAIEPLRADKKVGSSLEVAVWIKAENDAILKANEKDLADIYIVSQANLAKEKPEDVLNEYVEDGYTVWVTKARGEKCTRCWKYRELNSDGICPDCVEAIK
ncbi:TPA: isoleucine--tRNA ligase [Candidatus Gastranaerophilales bacterium HUM_6]|nr:isoleucine--tRNA ligase [Fusobacterium sp. CAG:815]DAA90300.1 MAG TPA: isoleucine--tRNA ligase [Candidatus Gastranaerophilales bacterium HUM_6]DAA95182.1 MAG TPA: isoleucine--tRNA ligase [Candidatus Gastranaerophilales bacterium HUM_7]DAB02592.1 MAG TPA: isoleucine--tRNA ligase [Candidatus Gastranaerophilales bacterium HUM_12]DAB06344.1 MAG TPA: isoleucine--tRNA ligase [Candidatus Gastranaerophilales bacterium HUM_14]